MVFKVNGGIINNQTLTGSLRFFKMTGPFAWTVSDGSVNLPVTVSGGAIDKTTYFAVAPGKPVPNSAAEFAFQEITKQADVVLISLQPEPPPGQPPNPGATNEIQFAVSASAFGWGSNEPPYDLPPADKDADPAAAATQMTEAIQALGTKTVYVSGGAPNPETAPVTADVDMGSVTVTEVPFKLA